MNHDDQWRCSVCKQWHVVPSLARDCEHKHTTPPGK